MDESGSPMVSVNIHQEMDTLSLVRQLLLPRTAESPASLLSLAPLQAEHTTLGARTHLPLLQQCVSLAPLIFPVPGTRARYTYPRSLLRDTFSPLQPEVCFGKAPLKNLATKQSARHT